MGRVDSFVDVTGKMSPSDVVAENIKQLVAEMNRNSDQLDAIANNLNIINKGKISGSIGGAISAFNPVVSHGMSTAPIFLAFFNYTGAPNNWYPVGTNFYDTGGIAIANTNANTDAAEINIWFGYCYPGGTVPNWNITFTWYIIQQPANIQST